tara:strand:+ start:287 stop:559 length:273 start_codon:yes stop_codon:yes gene_type:complete
VPNRPWEDNLRHFLNKLTGDIMQNHIEDLRLIAESINRELNYNSINKHETKRDIEMIIDGILPCLLRNCDELGIMDHVKSMIKIIEDYKK